MQEIRPRLFFDFVFSSFCFFHPRCKQNFVVVFVSFFLELESIETRKFKIVKIRGIYPRCNEISSSFSCRFFLSQNRQITARKSETKMYPIGRGAIGVTPLPPPPFLRQQMMGGGVPPPLLSGPASDRGGHILELAGACIISYRSKMFIIAAQCKPRQNISTNDFFITKIVKKYY